MAKIIKPEDVIPSYPIRMILYGSPGVGKTTLAQTSSQSVLTIDTERGIGRAAKGARKDVIQVETYQDIEQAINDKLIDNYKTVAIDSMTGLMRIITTFLLTVKKKDKKGNETPWLAYTTNGSVLHLQGYGELRARFEKLYVQISGGKRDLIIIAHDKEVIKDDETKSIFDIMGSSKGFINQNADAIGRVFKVGTSRFVDFNGDTEKGFLGKNTQDCLGGSKPILIPEVGSIGLFLGNLISQLKKTMCSTTDKVVENAALIKEWVEKVGNMKIVEDFNEFGLLAVNDFPKELEAQVKTILNDAALKLGFKFDKAKKCFLEPEAAQEPKSETGAGPVQEAKQAAIPSK